jgi:hypothetical protein
MKVHGAVPVLPPRRGAGYYTFEGLVARADVQGGIQAEVTRCRLTLSKSELKARLISAL